MRSHILQGLGMIALAFVLCLGISGSPGWAQPGQPFPHAVPPPAQPLARPGASVMYTFQGAIQANRIETQSIRIRHPRGRYVMDLGATEQGSRITIADGTGRALVLTVDDREGGLLLYSAGGRHRIGLGQVGSEPPLLAIDQPNGRGWQFVGERGVIPGRAPALRAGPDPDQPAAPCQCKCNPCVCTAEKHCDDPECIHNRASPAKP